jgi:hypothetical protein
MQRSEADERTARVRGPTSGLDLHARLVFSLAAASSTVSS